MLLWTKQVLFAKNFALLLQFIFGQGYNVTMGECYRTQEQAEIYFKEHKGIEHSLHCKRLAVDLNILDKDGKYLTDAKYYKSAGDYWHSLHPHNRWGGSFQHGCAKGDFGHFEMQDIESPMHSNIYLTGVRY